MKTRLLVLLAALAVAGCGSAPPPERPARGPMEPTAEQRNAAVQAYDTFMTSFMDWYDAAHPVRSTELGIHAFDGQMPDRSREGTQHRIDELLEWLRRMERLNPRMLSIDDRVDMQLVEFAIRGELLNLEEIRDWARNPRFYHDVIARGVESLVAGEYAPVDERTRSLVARLEAVPGILEAARDNLSEVPRVWVQMGAQEARATAHYLRTDVPEALAAQRGGPGRPMLQAQLDAAIDRAATALGEYAGWLERDVLPRAGGDFRLGRYIFLRKLLYDEQVDLTAEDMARISNQQVQQLSSRLEDAAREIDPDRTPRAILDSLEAITVPPDSIVGYMRERIDAARSFVVSHDLLTLPDAPLPTVRLAPTLRRSLERVALVMPGAFDTTGAPAYLEIDPALADTLTLEEGHFARLSRADLSLVAVHHVVPGHFVQEAYVRQLESRPRRTFQPRSLVEGWAHYAEQLVMDEGYGADDPALRLVQLHRALERQARWDAGLHLHALEGTLQEAIQRFQDVALVDEATARSEVLRGTWDPIYLSDALGRLQIQELRSAYRERKEGKEEDQPADSAGFSLREFHDTFLKLGVPATLARPVMLPRTPAPQEEEGRRRRRPVRIPPG